MSKNSRKAPSLRTNSKRIEAGLISTLITSRCVLPNRFAVITPKFEQFFKTQTYEALKRKINRQNWKLQNRFVKDLVLRGALDKGNCALVFIPKTGKLVTPELEAAFAIMGGQDTEENMRELPSEALVNFFANGMQYFPDDGCASQAWREPLCASYNLSEAFASPASSESMEESVGESDSACENQYVNELTSMAELFSQAPTLVASSSYMYLPPQQCIVDEVYTSYDDELSDCSTAPRALVSLDEKGVMGNDVATNRPGDCLPETFEEFFASNQLTLDSETNSLSHHGYPHSF